MEYEDDFGIVGVTLANAFHVERVVAHGGFAIVYRGIHGGFRAPIALKCLRIPEGMTAEQHNTFLERFREEGEFLFRLSAAIPEVVRPLHIDAVMLPTGQLMPFLALEWLDGEGFDQLIDRTMRERKVGLELSLVVEMLRPVAQALTRAHNFPTESGSLCVVHRDLKPENLFLCQVAGAPSIKILDYGIAEAMSVVQMVSGGRSWGGMNPFTPGYGAPEQWAPDRYGANGPWTDVWGLAITMTEALLGRPPIDGELEMMRRTALDPRRRPTPRALGCAVSNEVEAVFQRAMTLEPQQRTQSIEAFWNELERAMGVAALPGPAGPAMGRKRRGERELEESFQDASIDLALAVQPESLRTPLRATMPSEGSVPPPRGSVPSMAAVRPSQASMAAVRPSQGSMPAYRAELMEEASEADLPTHDQAPISQPMPLSGPRSVRSTPISMRGAPISTRELDLSSGAFGDAPPASGRVSMTVDAPARPRFEREPGSPVSEVAEVLRNRLRTPGILLATAIAITLIDLAFARFGSGALSLGPVRAPWLAGPLAVVGALLLVWKIVSDD